MAQQNLAELFRGFLETGPKLFVDRNALAADHVPERILHRDSQVQELAVKLMPALRGDKPSNTFLYGTTGTGKTLTVRHVASELEKASPAVRVLFVNCKMKRVSDTEYRLIAELARALGGAIPATGLPTDEVYRQFFRLVDAKPWSVILVLDEIDALVRNIGDGLLYSLTRTSQELKQAKLSVVGISNDLSFRDLLDPRVVSSLSEEEIVFPPYNALQLQDILSQRAALAFGPAALAEGVVAKCAALAAQQHGDARRALDLLRVAAEVVEREARPRILLEDIDKAEAKLDLDRVVTVVRSQPRQSQAVLAAILRLSEDGPRSAAARNNWPPDGGRVVGARAGSGSGAVQTSDILAAYEQACAARGLKPLTQRRVSDLIAELDMLGIITARVISRGRYGRTREIRLALDAGVREKVRAILNEAGFAGLARFNSSERPQRIRGL